MKIKKQTIIIALLVAVLLLLVVQVLISIGKETESSDARITNEFVSENTERKDIVEQKESAISEVPKNAAQDEFYAVYDPSNFDVTGFTELNERYAVSDVTGYALPAPNGQLTKRLKVAGSEYLLMTMNAYRNSGMFSNVMFVQYFSY